MYVFLKRVRVRVIVSSAESSLLFTVFVSFLKGHSLFHVTCLKQCDVTVLCFSDITDTAQPQEVTCQVFLLLFFLVRTVWYTVVIKDNVLE